MIASASAVSSSVLALLREATRARHAELDAGVNISTPQHYGRFLTASFAAVSGIEPLVDRALGRTGTERTLALASDLAELGLATPPVISISVGSRDGALGAAYVLEGSSLGGMLLATRVESFTSATRYLRLRGKETAMRWRQFLETLESEVGNVEHCIAGACQAFDHYAHAFRCHAVLA